MTITAKYPGRCSKCGGAIQPGQQVDWDRDTRETRHVKCPTGAAEKPAAAIPAEEAPIRARYTGRHKADGPRVGEVLRHKEHGIITVLRVDADYVSADWAEDNDDFCFDGDAHYHFTAHCRPATEAEAAPVLAEEAKAAAEAEATARAEAERKTADAATAQRAADLLAGLVSTDSHYMTPGGSWEEVARWHDSYGHSRTLYRLPDGRYIEQLASAFSDDARATLHGTPEAIAAAWEAWIAANPGAAPTPAEAREWLETYRGCVGTAFHEWRAAQE